MTYAEIPADTRLADGADAEQDAFVIGGVGLVLMGLPARLAVAGHLDALRALNGVSYLWLMRTGTSSHPAFDLRLEADDETWALIAPHADVIADILHQLGGATWELSHAAPLAIEIRGRQTELTRQGVAEAFRFHGAHEAAGMAERAVGFRLRPRPGGGRHLVTVWGDSSLTDEEATDVDHAVFQTLQTQTSRARSPGFRALASLLEPQVDLAPQYRPRIAVVTGMGEAMPADTMRHLGDVFDVDHRTIRVSQHDAAAQLGNTLRELSTSDPRNSQDLWIEFRR